MSLCIASTQPRDLYTSGSHGDSASEVAMEMRSPEVVVETRSQRHQDKIEPIVMTNILIQNMLPTELRRLQQEDVTLDRVKPLADDGIVKATDKAEVVFT